jgi:hypothetical protein
VDDGPALDRSLNGACDEQPAIDADHSSVSCHVQFMLPFVVSVLHW